MLVGFSRSASTAGGCIMGSATSREGHPLVETIAVPDTYVSGIAAVEPLYPCARFVLYVDHTSIDGSAPERIVVAKLICPLEGLPAVVRQILNVMAEHGVTMASLGRKLS